MAGPLPAIAGAGGAGLQWRLDDAPVGSALGFLRDAARIIDGSLRRAAARVSLRGLSRMAGGGLSLGRRMETAWLASGAATQLADAALSGETTGELAVRIAQIARTLGTAEAAAVYARTAAGLKALGADQECGGFAQAAAAMASGHVQRDLQIVAIPLQMHETPVGVLTLRYRPGDAPQKDLRALQPLLARAGAVLAAAEREARKDRFLSLAAHELKTPLTSIKGFSYALARRLERGQTCDPRHVEMLERQAERLHSLLEEMLEVSRLETGRFVLHPEPCDLRELIDSCQRSLRRLGSGAEVAADTGGALPLLADRERIERALSAMVVRARAHGSAVQLHALREGGSAQVRVSWTGAPLSAEDQAQAFSPRWESPQAQRQGLGMALFIAREAALLHGGRLRCEADALVLELPLKAEERDPHAGGAEASVLVVDDDEALARTMAEFLSESGFVAEWAASGAAALRKMEKAAPHLLVLDLRMPEMDGPALLQAVRAGGHTPRVVLLSADREVARVARELAAEAFVEKPFAPDGLLAAVRRALAPRAK